MSKELFDEIDNEISANTPQGTDSWLKQREGKITSSKYSKLMGGVSREMTQEELDARPKTGTGSKAKTIEDESGLNDTAMSYLYEIASEITSGQRIDTASTYAMKYGEENEGYGRELFAKVTGKEIDFCGFVRWKEDAKYAGGSPDGKVIGETAIIEIKSPLNGGNHIKYSRIKKLTDLPDEYMWQCIGNMLVTESTHCYFISYDPRQKTEATQLKWVRFEKDAELERRLIIKLRAAIFELQTIVDEFLTIS